MAVCTNYVTLRYLFSELWHRAVASELVNVAALLSGISMVKVHDIRRVLATAVSAWNLFLFHNPLPYL